LSGLYHQKWKPTNQHTFPTNLPQLLPGSQEVKDRWQELAPVGSTLFGDYLKKLAIETNQVESTFLLTEGVRLLAVDLLHLAHNDQIS